MRCWPTIMSCHTVIWIQIMLRNSKQGHKIYFDIPIWVKLYIRKSLVPYWEGIFNRSHFRHFGRGPICLDVTSDTFSVWCMCLTVYVRFQTCRAAPGNKPSPAMWQSRDLRVISWDFYVRTYKSVFHVLHCYNAWFSYFWNKTELIPNFYHEIGTHIKVANRAVLSLESFTEWSYSVILCCFNNLMGNKISS